MHLENLYQAVADFYREAEASTPIGHIQRLLLNWMESSDFEEVGQKYRNEEVFGVMQVIYHISKIGEQLAKCDHFETKIKTAKGV